MNKEKKMIEVAVLRAELEEARVYHKRHAKEYSEDGDDVMAAVSSSREEGLREALNILASAAEGYTRTLEDRRARVKVVMKRIPGEWCAVPYINGKRDADRTFYTQSKRTVLDTGNQMFLDLVREHCPAAVRARASEEV